MIDLWRAMFGRCPWCVHVEGRQWLDHVPRWFARWWLFSVDGLWVWRLGRMWHEGRHGVVP